MELEKSSEWTAFFLPHIYTVWRRCRTESDTAHRRRTPAPEPRWGTGSPASEAHCPDTFPDLSCQKNKPTIGLAPGQRSLFTQRWKRSSANMQKRNVKLECEKCKAEHVEWQTAFLKPRRLGLYGALGLRWKPLKHRWSKEWKMGCKGRKKAVVCPCV